MTFSASAAGADETLAALSTGFTFGSPSLDRQRVPWGGYSWIRTAEDLSEADRAGAVEWSFAPAAPGDRFFLLPIDALRLARRHGLEPVGELDGRAIVRLPASAERAIPPILALQEIPRLDEFDGAAAPYPVTFDPRIQAIIDAIDPDSLYAIVSDLSGIHTRFCMSDYYETAAQYAEARLQACGWAVESQYFDFWGYVSRNVIATKPGTVSPDTTVILCGHLDSATYDSFDDPNARAPGADDNASSSAAILEAARLLQDYSFHYTVKLILFGAEEIGLYGSAAFADEAASEGLNILCALNGDMIAYEPDAMDVSVICNTQSAWVGDLMIAMGEVYTPDLDVVKVISPGSESSDHASFWDVGYTSAWLFEGTADYSPFIHSTADVITSLNFAFYTESTKLFVGALAQMASEPAVIGVPGDRIAPDVALRHVPEPAAGPLALILELDRARSGRLLIYDVAGRAVADLGMRRLAPGLNRVAWDGRVSDGRPAGSGVYVVRFESPGHVWSDRLTLVR
jgi:hypothetical protein